MPFLFDSHTHLQFSAFDKDRDEVIKRTLENDIWLTNVGSQKDTSKNAVELANKYPEGVYAAVGLHPIHTNSVYLDPQEIDGENGFNSRSEDFDYEFYKNLALNEKVVAIGECGLDYYRIENNELEIKNKQREIFINHIKLADELKKPLMIHCRQAFPDLISVLTTSSQLLNFTPGIIHFFTGTIDDAKELLEMGFYFTFGGLITYNRQFDEIIKFIPLEKILLETDAPYVAPEPYRGRRNEPTYIKETAQKMAELKNASLEEISGQITQNAFKIFGIRK
ncbi:MAG: TatD family hydrolase [Candidatus Wolfebacteria bacterium]|nr:TatD family hydrolase [Candidatus Wolfebacteria bacterium]